MLFSEAPVALRRFQQPFSHIMALYGYITSTADIKIVYPDIYVLVVLLSPRPRDIGQFGVVRPSVRPESYLRPVWVDLQLLTAIA